MSDRRQQHEDFIKERRQGVERRAHPRQPVAITMELTAGGDLYFHVSANLSTGGAFFNRAIPHPVGTEVELTFQLPGPDVAPVRCRGEVVNVPEEGDGLGMGVRFLDLPEADTARVQAFIEAVAARVAEARAEANADGDGATGAATPAEGDPATDG